MEHQGEQGRFAAAHLRERRATIAGRLAALVADWPKYSDAHAADPAGFAEMESYALVDYLAFFLEQGDLNFQHLYVGEKAKQLHDPSVAAEITVERKRQILDAERAIFADELTALPEAAGRADVFFDGVAAALTGAAKAEVKALFVGDCLYLDLIGFVTAPALADGVRLTPTFITSHDPGEVRAQIAALADERFDVIFYSPFTYAFVGDYEALQRPRRMLAPGAAWRNVAAAVAAGLSIFDTLADLFDCPLVAHLPAPILRRGEGTKERVGAALTFPLRAAATRRIGAALQRRAADRQAGGQVVHLIDERAVAGAAGLRAAGRYLFRSYLQHPAAFGAMLAPVYRDILMVVGRLLKRKLIACDLDNTLWQGVIGEGLGVSHHLDRQAPLLTLKAHGVVLAINSKNDPAKVVWEAEEGRLGLDHFVSRQINWDPKPLNIKRIAQHLNLKEKDFVFIDDRADERALVEEAYPALLALDALDPRSWRLLALWAELLPSKPGADRTEFYRQRDARQAFIAAEAEESEEARAETFHQLKLKLVVREAAPSDVDRAAELINRTNQFNTTGARVSKRQVETLAASADATVLIADAADRFGSMGTIAVLIAERLGTNVAITAFVLSCRVFGYGMEQAILEEARRFCRAGESLSGDLVQTQFNQPCQTVYRTAGFAPAGNGWVLEDAAGRSITVPDWLTIERGAAPEAKALDAA